MSTEGTNPKGSGSTLNRDDTIIKRKFELLFREHFTALCCFARKYTGDLDAAREIVHIVFIRIWEIRSEFDWEKPARSYLYTSVYNRSLNYIRNQKKFISHDEVNAQLQINNESAFSDNLEAAEMESRIRSAIMRLPGKCREIFELSRFENKKYSEIAAHLNISVKTVETQMSKALYFLKEELKDYLKIVILICLKYLYHL
jgi:RNA polymerase sigma-70 factor (ECF subfamily)